MSGRGGNELKFYSMSIKERNELIGRMAEVLSDMGFISLAIVHGSFLRSNYFRDIDLAVFVSSDVSSLSDEIEHARMVEERLREELGISVQLDVRIANNAPRWFKGRIVRLGRVIVNRNGALHRLIKVLMEEGESMEHKRCIGATNIEAI